MGPPEPRAGGRPALSILIARRIRAEAYGRSTKNFIDPRQQPGEVELVGAGLACGFEVGALPVAGGFG